MTRLRTIDRGAVLAVTVFMLLGLVPFFEIPVPGLFSSPLNRPGTLQLLALCLTFAGVALSYNLLFGYTGLLSFGHALYFSAGAYLPAIAVTRWHLALATALVITAAAGVLLPLLLGALSLRVGGIAFAMVTLAFAQAGSILVFKNPGHLTGGEEGLALDYTRLPAALVGIANTPNLYWIAFAYLVLTFAVCWWAVGSRPGRVWQAIRENERRVEVMGLQPYVFKLLAFTLAGFLATAGGVVYLVLLGGATPSVTTAGFSLSVLLMVVLGGSATLWGPALGGALYEYLDFRLLKLSSSGAVDSLPPLLRAPLSEPLFILGTLFVLLVYFFPGGIAGFGSRAFRRVFPAAAAD
ncbi:MAG: branched-chain amino acid ABC transporter permease [Candidatus Dormibacteraceae bacterium]